MDKYHICVSLIEAYYDTLKRTLNLLDRRKGSDFILTLLAVRDPGKHIFAKANGGSSATASYMV